MLGHHCKEILLACRCKVRRSSLSKEVRSGVGAPIAWFASPVRAWDSQGGRRSSRRTRLRDTFDITASSGWGYQRSVPRALCSAAFHCRTCCCNRRTWHFGQSWRGVRGRDPVRNTSSASHCLQRSFTWGSEKYGWRQCARALGNERRSAVYCSSLIP